MSAVSFLIGLPANEAVYMPEGTEEIAYANDWIPLGWLALFEIGDVRMVPETGSEDQALCPTLLTRKDLALSTFRRRLVMYAGAMSPQLLDIFRYLERLVVHSSSDYLQVSLTDMDIFISEPDDMTETLRDWIGAMDTTLASQWAGPLGFVQATVGKDLGEIHFPDLELTRAAIAGYV